MKKACPKQLRVVYKFASPDPANEKTVAQRLDRAFDVLFEAVLEAESDARKLPQISKQNKAVLAPEPMLDNSVQLRI